MIWKTHERNIVETIVDSDGILQVNENHMEEGLDHKNLKLNPVKYLSGYRKHRYELVDEPKKQPNRIFIRKELAIKLNMDSTATATHKFRTTLGFNQ